MTEITLLLAAMVAGSVGYIINVPMPTLLTPPGIMIPQNWALLQKRMMPLFEEVCSVNSNAMIQNLANDFLSTTEEEYLRPEVLTNLQNLRTGKGMLPKGDIFTEFDDTYLDELRIVSDVMIYAKTFDTFIKAAAWSKQTINCGLYVDALYLAMIYRRDVEKLSLPAPYELMPNYFVHKDDMMKAAYLLTTGETTFENARREDNAYVLDTEYTSALSGDNDIANMAYFHEDIGLNSYYLLRKLSNVPWLNALDERYGENLYQFMKQLSTRYDLERYSNNLPELEEINWETYVSEIYNPNLIYLNGTDFESRSSSVDNTMNIQYLLNIESNIASVVTHLMQSGYNKTQIVNHIMEILVTQNKSYEIIAREILGTGKADCKLSVLDHYMTSLRDPAFWILNKKMVSIIDRALRNIPSYTRSELYFPGVQIASVDVKKVMTSLDYFEFDVTDAFDTNENYRVKIGQKRLNNKAFTVKITINSLVAKKGLVKIFLGPKVLPGEFAAKKKIFMLLDSFEMNFKLGSNAISRSSAEMTNLSGDFISLNTLRRNVEDAEYGIDALPLKPIMSQTGFPSRMVLPKGAPEGLPFQLFVFIAPIEKTSIIDGKLNIQFNDAIVSTGFPLDLKIENTQMLQLPNAITKEILITHKPESKPSGNGGDYANKVWNTNGDYVSQYFPRSEPYTQNQYKKQDYASKRGSITKKYDQYETSTTENNLIVSETDGTISNDISSTILRPVLRLVSSKPKQKVYVSEVKNDAYNNIDQIILQNNIASVDNNKDGSIIHKDIVKDISKDFTKDITKEIKKDFTKEITKNMNKDIKKDVKKDIVKNNEDTSEYDQNNEISEVVTDFKENSIKSSDEKSDSLEQHTAINKSSEEIVDDDQDRIVALDMTLHDDETLSLENTSVNKNIVNEKPSTYEEDNNYQDLIQKIPPVLKLTSSKYKDLTKFKYNKNEAPDVTDVVYKKVNKKSRNKSIEIEDNNNNMMFSTVPKDVTKDSQNKNSLHKMNRTSNVIIHIEDLTPKKSDEDTDNTIYSTIIKDIIKEVENRDEPVDITLHVTDSGRKYQDIVMDLDSKNTIEKSTKNNTLFNEKSYVKDENMDISLDNHMMTVKNNIPEAPTLLSSKNDTTDNKKEIKTKEKKYKIESPTVTKDMTKDFKIQSYVDDNDKTSEVAIHIKDSKPKNIYQKVNTIDISTITKDITKVVKDNIPKNEPIEVTVHVSDLDGKNSEETFYDHVQNTFVDKTPKSREIMYEIPYMPLEKPQFPMFLEAKDRVPTVYDYIVHPPDDNDDEEEIRVYE